MRTLLTILQYLPHLISAIRALEDAVPVPGQGKAKLDIILGTVDAVYETSKDLNKEMPKEQLLGVLVKVAGTIVSTFNKLGVFGKTTPAPATA